MLSTLTENRRLLPAPQLLMAFEPRLIWSEQSEVKMEMKTAIAQGERTRLKVTLLLGNSSSSREQCPDGMGKVLAAFMNELGRAAQVVHELRILTKVDGRCDSALSFRR